MCETSLSSALQERTQCLQELADFTQTCQAELKDLFEALGWSPESDTHAAQMDVCPYNPNHTVQRDRMERHKTACRLSQLGYSKEEQAEMCDPSVCYENTTIPSIIIDKETMQQVILQARANVPPMGSAHAQITGVSNKRRSGLDSFPLILAAKKILNVYLSHYVLGTVPSSHVQFLKKGDYSTDAPDVPHNHKRALCDLTAADRLALYDHAIQEANQQSARRQPNNEDLYVDLVAKLKRGDDQSEPKSHLEVLAEMRDYRRRRQSYRAKNVHITKKSYTEVIRDVIDVHSGELARVWQEEKESKASQQSSRRRASETDRSASAESRDSRVSSRDEHGGKRHRKRSRERENKSKSKRDSHSPGVKRHHKKKKKHKS